MSEINLMKKFNIKPYKHKVNVRKIYLNGKLYGEEILKINDTYLRERVEKGITNIAALSLRINIPTKASAPHTIAHAFRNLAGLGASTGHTFKQAEGMIGGGAPSQGGAKKEEKKKEEKKPEPKKEEPKKEEPEEELPLFDF